VTLGQNIGMYVIQPSAITLTQWRALVEAVYTHATEVNVYFSSDSNSDKVGLPSYMKDAFARLAGEDAPRDELRFSLATPAGQRFRRTTALAVPGQGGGLYAWDVLGGDAETLLAVRDMSDIFVAKRFSGLVPVKSIIYDDAAAP